MRLESKVAVVTGGTRGLGAALVERLVLEGCQVASVARHLPDEEIGVKPSLFIPTDVSQREEAGKVIDAVRQRHASLDLLVNNAGYGGQLAKAWETPEEEFSAHLDNNLMAAVCLTQLVLPGMLAQGQGSLVYIASQAGKRAVPGLSAYSASKFALVGFAEAVAKEIEGSGVKVLIICPAGMNTAMREAVFHDAASQQSPATVANTIVGILCNSPELPNGAEVIIQEGKIVHVERSRTY